MPPSVTQLDQLYAAAPPDPAVYWLGHETVTGSQQTSLASHTPPENPVNTKLTYDLPALVDLALHANPETRASWEEAKTAAASLEKNRSVWYPRLTAMVFGQYSTPVFLSQAAH